MNVVIFIVLLLNKLTISLTKNKERRVQEHCHKKHSIYCTCRCFANRKRVFSWSWQVTIGQGEATLRSTTETLAGRRTKQLRRAIRIQPRISDWPHHTIFCLIAYRTLQAIQVHTPKDGKLSLLQTNCCAKSRIGLIVSTKVVMFSP